MLDIDFTFLWTAINLLVLYIFVKKFLFGRVGAYMEKRSNAIADDIEQGAALKAEGQKYALETKEILDKAANDGRNIIEASKIKANKEYDDIVAAARAEAARIISESREMAVREREKVEKSMKVHIADLAISAATKVVEQNMDTAKNRDIVTSFLNKEGAA